MKKTKQSSVVTEGLESLILQIRGQRVMLDADLARVYGVTTKQLNQQLKRNQSRFPEDFAFQLSKEDFLVIRSQNVTTSRRPITSVPWVFTEHGANDVAIIELFSTLKQLIEGPDEAEGPKRQIGFHVKDARNGKETVGI